MNVYYTQGYYAYRSYTLQSDNPHSADRFPRREWNRGWLVAFAENFADVREIKAGIRKRANND